MEESKTLSQQQPTGAVPSVDDTSCTACGCIGDVLHWRNPITTGCILGCINASFFLFTVLRYSFCSLVCHAALFFMAFGLVVSLLLKSSVDAQRVEIVSKKNVDETVLWLYDVVNDTAGSVRHIILWHDMARSGKVAAAIFGFAWIASWLTFPALVFIGTWILFTYVYIMDAYRTHLEPVVRPHLAKAMESASQAYNKIPRMSETKKIE